MTPLIALLLSWFAQPPGPDAAVGSWYASTDGVRYVSIVTRAAIEQSPRWRADADAPPLAPRVALRAAIAAMTPLTSGQTPWSAREIRLSPLLLPDAWVYVVHFDHPPIPPAAGARTQQGLVQGLAGGGPVEPMQIVVLMTGKAIVPRPTR